MIPKKGPHLHLKQEQYTMENGKVTKEMVLESKFGLMEPNMKENGFKIKHMVKVNFGM
jgi:hypothetical protein